LKKIAFIKFGGLSSGGTEVNLQDVAIHLAERYEVDFYYCDSAPYIGSDWIHPDTDQHRKKIVEKSKVRLIKFNVAFKDITNELHTWIDTNFWDLFEEKKYSLIFTSTAGSPEYPFVNIKNTPMINVVTVNAGVNNQENIYKTILISNDSASKWLDQGGDKDRYEIIPVFRKELERSRSDFRKELRLENKFIYGFHQRADDSIFSPVQLKAYKKVENKENFFFVLGGSKLYSAQSNDLGINNFKQLDSSADPKIIDKFLNTLNVFTHGRKHGETMGLVITEAMNYGLPIISHRAEANAQEEVIGNAGKVFNKRNIFSYSKEMKKLSIDKEYYYEKSTAAKSLYNEKFSSKVILDKYEDLVKQVLSGISK
tara:strand:- start:3661 stop:4767 length:1107 start_codon:yes stop_codon:yes gene_type:complete